MTRTTTLRLVAAALSCAWWAAPAHALDLTPHGASLEVGAGGKGTAMAGVGLVWDWDFERLRRSAELTAHTELLLNHWRAHGLGGGHLDVNQLVVLPSLRM